MLEYLTLAGRDMLIYIYLDLCLPLYHCKTFNPITCPSQMFHDYINQKEHYHLCFPQMHLYWFYDTVLFY